MTENDFAMGIFACRACEFQVLWTDAANQEAASRNLDEHINAEHGKDRS
jgi:hypothetical protein